MRGSKDFPEPSFGLVNQLPGPNDLLGGVQRRREVGHGPQCLRVAVAQGTSKPTQGFLVECSRLTVLTESVDDRGEIVHALEGEEMVLAQLLATLDEDELDQLARPAEVTEALCGTGDDGEGLQRVGVLLPEKLRASGGNVLSNIERFLVVVKIA
jgi:hypothetical protein